MAVQYLSIDAFLKLAQMHLLLDVRSPGEYLHAHIPGACSLPLFSDEERAKIGTAYKQVSREAAIKIGLDAFGPKMRQMVEEVEILLAKKGSQNDKTVLVHCWRGGMRSSAVAWLLDLYGFHVFLLEGGYKAYRNWVIQHWEDTGPVQVLGGFTGAGKTKVLAELKTLGEPVLDLESLAAHKGSAFGGLDKKGQPSQEMFENNLAMALEHLRTAFPARAIWIEDESQRIGNLNIPFQLFRQWNVPDTPVLFLDLPFEERLSAIVDEYGGHSTESLINAIVRIKKRLGPLETKTSIAHLVEGELRECFSVLLHYYDKQYAQRPSQRSFSAAGLEPKKLQLLSNITSMSSITEPIRLTQFAKATGCSCKISPAQLREMLGTDTASIMPKELLVGNSSNDDAAVYALDDKTALIATTDFFTPVVDDAFDFGRIAAANALSDVYAMGGKPLMALAVLGWPVDTLPTTIAQQVLEGARAICAEAGIPLAGGHSIIAAEPFFGLCVNGTVQIASLKKNSTARDGDVLLLTKPLGAGILTTAAKRGVLPNEHYPDLIAQLTKLNSIGEKLGQSEGVTAMTDVTGFGLLGHLIEMAEGSDLSAVLNYTAIQIPQIARELAAQRIVPDATYRNWNSYSTKTGFAPGMNVMEAFNILPDPQTNGGLLIAVRRDALSEVQALLSREGYKDFAEPIGQLIAKGEKVVMVQ